jgi:hypothetical protein
VQAPAGLVKRAAALSAELMRSDRPAALAVTPDVNAAELAG